MRPNIVKLYAYMMMTVTPAANMEGIVLVLSAGAIVSLVNQPPYLRKE